MAEAKKLGAHAIINVVVDYKDNETHSIVRRHVEAGHKPTPVEQKNIRKAYLLSRKQKTARIFMLKISARLKELTPEQCLLSSRRLLTNRQKEIKIVPIILRPNLKI